MMLLRTQYGRILLPDPCCHIQASKRLPSRSVWMLQAESAVSLHLKTQFSTTQPKIFRPCSKAFEKPSYAYYWCIWHSNKCAEWKTCTKASPEKKRHTAGCHDLYRLSKQSCHVCSSLTVSATIGTRCNMRGTP